MGGSAGAEASDALVRSVAIMSEYHWMLLRHLYNGTRARLGEPGITALGRGLWRYGYYRGQSIRDDPRTIASGRDAFSLIEHWDGGELALASARGEVEISGTPSEVQVTLPFAPGADYFAKEGSTQALNLHWDNVLSGMAAGYDDAAVVTHRPAPDDNPFAPWSVTWAMPSPRGGRVLPTFKETLARPARYIRIARRTTGLIAALQMYTARELIEGFDASGEEVAREASYKFGAERGKALRDRHLAEGTPLNLQTMGQTLAERDPLQAIFAIRGDSYVSPGLSHFDCTYCPLAEVWAEEGAEGLALGYLFDMELHRGLVETYYPGAVIKWDALKTRGDSICRFRFQIPELVTPDEQLRTQSSGVPTRRPGSVHVPTAFGSTTQTR